MTIIAATKRCFKNYLNFSDRANRSEFWKFVLFIMLGSIVCTIANSTIFGPTIEDTIKITIDASGEQKQTVQKSINYNGGWLSDVFSVVCIIPFLAVTWRRMHDIGKSGWYALALPTLGIAISAAIFWFNSKTIPLDSSAISQNLNMPSEMTIPSSGLVFFIGWLCAFLSIVVTIILLAKKSDVGSNKYGPEPPG